MNNTNNKPKPAGIPPQLVLISETEKKSPFPQHHVINTDTNTLCKTADNSVVSMLFVKGKNAFLVFLKNKSC